MKGQGDGRGGKGDEWIRRGRWGGRGGGGRRGGRRGRDEVTESEGK